MADLRVGFVVPERRSAWEREEQSPARLETAGLSKARPFTDDERQQIITAYLNGKNVHTLAGMFHCRKSRISVVLREAEVLGELHRRASQAKRGKPQGTYVSQSSGLPKSPSPIEWAYIAGVFDGEGSLTTDNKDARNYRVSVVQKDHTLLYWIRQTVGAGYVQLVNGGKDTGTYRLQRQRQVFEFLLAIHPYLIVKKDKTREAIEHLSQKYGWEESWAQGAQ